MSLSLVRQRDLRAAPIVHGMSFTPYLARRDSQSRFVTVRGLRYHVLEWGNASLARADRPPLVMLHGWMDVGASF